MSAYDDDNTIVKARWTILIYMNGKNDLQDMLLQNWNEMVEAGSTEEVNVVVQMGRRSLSDTPEGPPSWTGVKRFLVKKDMACRAEHQVSDLHDAGLNTDMGSVDCFTDFLAWGKMTYPAEKTMVIIWDHGEGWRFFASSFDDVTQHCLYNTDVKNAIKNTFGNIEVLCFDACLMAMLETAYELREHVSYMVASEVPTPGKGFNYQFLHPLIENPDSDGLQLSRYITDSYAQKHLYAENVPDDTKDLITLSILDLSFAGAAVASLDTLTQVIRQSPAAIALAKKAREHFTTFDMNLSTSLDLISWVEYLITHSTAQPAFHASVAAIGQSIQKTVHYCYSNNINPNGVLNGRQCHIEARGIAVFFPENISQQNTAGRFRNGYYPSNNDHPVAFVKQSLWPQFLHDFWHIDLCDSWTVLIYMNGQNDRASCLQTSWEDIAQTGSTDRVKVVVQMGRASHSDPANGWTGAKRFLVKKGMSPEARHQLLDVGEAGLSQNMNSSDSLSDFVRWGKQQYPAGKTLLIVWGECGSGRHTVDHEGSGTPDYISIHKALNGITVDMMGFDGSEMARLEAVYELRNCTPWLVASQSVMPATGWNYAFLRQLSDNPSATEADVASMILEQYQQKYTLTDPASRQPVTLSVLRPIMLAKHHFTLAFNSFVDAVLTDARTLDVARQARRRLPGYDGNTTGMIDLLSWVSGIQTHCDQQSRLHTDTDALQSLLTSLVVRHYSRRGDPASTALSLNSRGISVFLPENTAQRNQVEANHNLSLDISRDPHVAAFSKSIPHWSSLLQQISR